METAYFHGISFSYLIPIVVPGGLAMPLTVRITGVDLASV